MEWPRNVDQLIADQLALRDGRPPPWQLAPGGHAVGGCFICFPKGQSGYGDAGDAAWASAVTCCRDGSVETASATGLVQAPYRAGLLALREGPLLERMIRKLPRPPEVLLVNATGRDHPRRAGLALHLGAMLSLPTVGVTDRPLLGQGEWPALIRGRSSPLVLDGEAIGYWLCSRTGARPLVVHAAWRSSPDIARDLVMSVLSRRARTPRPIRLARQVARRLRDAGSAA